MHYKKLSQDFHYPVLVGQDFGHHLTGDEQFYFELGNTFSKIAQEFDGTELLEKTIKELSETQTIKDIAKRC